jgi:hypothetical protein
MMIATATINKKNKKIRKLKKISFKSYIKKFYVDSDTFQKKKKKKKISGDDFQILQFSEYSLIENFNYNVRQLKAICKYYKQKSSGNKKELTDICYNYLRLSFYVTKIQKSFRGHIVRYLDRLRGPAFKTRKCNNESDFFSLENIKDIPSSQFISYKDKDNFIYGFDICSLYNMIEVEKMEKINPYNRNDLPINMLKNIQTICRLGKLLGYKLNIKIDNTIEGLSQEKKIELKTIEIFQKIDDLGFITNSQWFLLLNRHKLKSYLNELIDIWNYRAQLTAETKYKINPQRGNPFYGYNINIILQQDKITLQKKILEIIEIFISRGESTDARSLGVYYVLGALTMVCNSAANSLPWLYESFVIT